ncbi:MAG: hypothetical protein SFU83_24645 [Meiothermus sp.]|nr:hypothetical protein [Meiothermus sp.]
MPQLHLYVSKEIAEALTQKAKAQNVSVSRYLAEIVRREVGPSWPEGYEHTLGGWRGEAPVRADFEPSPSATATSSGSRGLP